LETKDGRHVSVEFVSNIYDCDGVDVIQCNIRDNTKRHLTEIALRAAARALQMLSEGNFALISSTTEEALLAEYCRIAVETGGYQRASVGVADNDPTRSIRTVSQLCRHGVCIAMGQNTWDDTADLGFGIAAIRAGSMRSVYA
jgi:hypothetical protein